MANNSSSEQQCAEDGDGVEGARLRSAPVLHRHRQQRDLGSRNGGPRPGARKARPRKTQYYPGLVDRLEAAGCLYLSAHDHFAERAAVTNMLLYATMRARLIGLGVGGDRASRRAGDLALPVDGVAPAARLRPHRRHHPRRKRRELRGARLRGGEELPVDGRIWSVGDDAPVDQPLRRRPLPPQSGRADHPGRLVHARRPREHGSRAAVDHQRPLGVPLVPPQRGDAGGRRVLPRPRGDRRPPRRRRQDDGDHATKHVHGGEEVWE